MPMGLCYPGKGKSGDLPPRPECAPTWHDKVLMLLPNIELTLLIGQYAQAYYLRDAAKGSLTETVRCWADYGPAWLPLPHPSPRNTFWLKKNPWFEQDVIPICNKGSPRCWGDPRWLECRFDLRFGLAAGHGDERQYDADTPQQQRQARLLIEQPYPDGDRHQQAGVLCRGYFARLRLAIGHHAQSRIDHDQRRRAEGGPPHLPLPVAPSHQASAMMKGMLNTLVKNRVWAMGCWSGSA